MPTNRDDGRYTWLITSYQKHWTALSAKSVQTTAKECAFHLIVSVCRWIHPHPCKKGRFFVNGVLQHYCRHTQKYKGRLLHITRTPSKRRNVPFAQIDSFPHVIGRSYVPDAEHYRQRTMPVIGSAKAE